MTDRRRNDTVTRDYIDAIQFAELMSRHGVNRDSTIVLYGDKSNWWATYAMWVFKLFGHEDIRIMTEIGRMKQHSELVGRLNHVGENEHHHDLTLQPAY